MPLPESMSRIVVVGTKSSLEEAIEAFYGLKVLHVIDHTAGADNMSIGTPLSRNTKASERLLKVRAMEKELGVGKSTETANVPVAEIRGQISSGSVESIEAEVLEVLDVKNDLNQRITELNAGGGRRFDRRGPHRSAQGTCGLRGVCLVQEEKGRSCGGVRKGWG